MFFFFFLIFYKYVNFQVSENYLTHEAFKNADLQQRMKFTVEEALALAISDYLIQKYPFSGRRRVDRREEKGWGEGERIGEGEVIF
jgi:hypothetical protein